MYQICEAEQISLAIATRAANIARIKEQLVKYDKSFYQNMGSLASIFYGLAGGATVTIGALNNFLPGVATFLRITRDITVAIPNIVAGTLFSFFLYYSQKKDSTKDKLRKQLLQEENELRILKIQEARLKIVEQKRVLMEIVEAQQTVLSKLRQTEGEGQKFTSESILTFNRLVAAEEKLKDLHQAVTRSNQYKSSRKRWRMAATFFYVVAAVVMFSPLSPFLLTIGLSMTVVAAGLSFVGAVFVAGSFIYAKKAHDSKLEHQDEYATKIEEVANLTSKLAEQETQEIAGLQAAIIAAQKELKSLTGSDPQVTSEKTAKLQAAFQEINSLSLELQQLRKQQDASHKKEEVLLEQDGRYKFHQKNLSIAAAAFSLFAAAIVIVGIVFPPFGALSLGGVGVATVCNIVCSVTAFLLSTTGSVYLGKKRKAIKDQIKMETTTQPRANDPTQEREKAIRLSIAEKLQVIVTEQEKEMARVQVVPGHEQVVTAGERRQTSFDSDHSSESQDTVLVRFQL